MKKRFYLIIFTLLLTITLVACTPKNTYKLTLPEFVTSDVSDINKVLDETLVTLTVSERDGFVLDELKANDVLLNVSNNKATFIMKEDTVISVSFNVLGEGVYYKLTLGENITANLTNLDKVLKGTNVTLKVVLPEGRTLNGFYINDVEKTLNTNLEYTFIIEEDVSAKVILNDEQKVDLDLVDILLIFKNTNPRLLSSDHRNYFDIELNDLVDSEKINGKLVFDLNENPSERLFYYLEKRTTDEVVDYNEHYVSKNSYYQTSDYLNSSIVTDFVLTDDSIAYLLSSITRESSLILNPIAFNDTIELLFNRYIDNLTEDSLINKITGTRVGTLNNLKLEIDKDDLLNLDDTIKDLLRDELDYIMDSDSADFKINIDLTIDNKTITKFKIEVASSFFNGTFSYGEYQDIELEFIDEKDFVENPKDFSIKVYDQERLLLDLKGNQYSLEYINKFDLFYKEGYTVEGVYFDQEFKELYIGQRITKDVNFYIKYQEIKEVSYYKDIIKGNFGYKVYGENYYYKTDKYEIIIEYGEITYVFDRETKFLYINDNEKYMNQDAEEYFRTRQFNYDLEEFLNNEFILLANNYISKDDYNNIITHDGYLEMYHASLLLINNEKTISDIEKSAEELLNNNFKNDEVRYVFYEGYSFYDLDKPELFDDVIMILLYESGYEKKIKFRELKKEFDITMTFSNEEGYNEAYIYLDSVEYSFRIFHFNPSKGIVLTNYSEYFYLNDLDSLNDLKEEDDFMFQTLVGVEINNKLYKTIDEIKRIENAKILEFNLVYKLKPFKDIKTLITSNTISVDYNYIYYDFNLDVVIINPNSPEQTIIYLGRDKYIIKNEKIYYEIDKTEYGLKFLENYDNSLQKVFIIRDLLKGNNDFIYNERYQIYENEDYEMNFNHGVSFYNKKTGENETFRLTADEIIYKDFEYNSESIIKNNLNTTNIKLKYNDNYYLDMYLFDILDDYDSPNLYKNEEIVYEITNNKDYIIKYQKKKTPNSYLNEIYLKDGLSIYYDKYLIKIDKNNNTEIYSNNKLVFVIIKENNNYTTYGINGNNKYFNEKLIKFINIAEIIELYKDAKFVKEDYYYITKDKFIEGLVSVKFFDYGIIIETEERDYVLYFNQIQEKEVEDIDLNGYILDNEVINNVIVNQVVSVEDLNDENIKPIIVQYKWLEFDMYTLNELKDLFEVEMSVSKEGLKLEILDNTSWKKFLLDVYDTNYEKTLIIQSTDYTRSIVYLSEFMDYSIAKVDGIKEFTGFMYDYRIFKTKEELYNYILNDKYNDDYFISLLYETNLENVLENIRNIILNNYLFSQSHEGDLYYDYKNKLMISDNYQDDFIIRYLKEFEEHYELIYNNSFLVVSKKDINNYEKLHVNHLNILMDKNITIQKEDWSEEFNIILDGEIIYSIRFYDNSEKYLFSLTDLNNYRRFYYTIADSLPNINIEEIVNSKYKTNIYQDDYLLTEVIFKENHYDNIHTFYYLFDLLYLNYELYDQEGNNILYDFDKFNDNLENGIIHLNTTRPPLQLNSFNQLDLYNDSHVVYSIKNIQVSLISEYLLIDKNGVVFEYDYEYYIKLESDKQYNIEFRLIMDYDYYKAKIQIIEFEVVAKDSDYVVDYNIVLIEDIFYRTPPHNYNYFKTEALILENIKFSKDINYEDDFNIFIIEEYNNYGHTLIVKYNSEIFENIDQYLDDETYNVKIILNKHLDEFNLWEVEIIEIY